MKGRYPEVENKIWLAVQSSRNAKSYAVYENGIGEELPFTLLGWVDDRLTIVCQAKHHRASRMERFKSVYEAAVILRRGWGCTSFIFIAEGYCVLDRTKVDKSIPLAQQFANGNTSVAECLTFMSIDISNIYILMIPYKYGLGRSVSYADPLKYPRKNDDAFIFPKMLQSTLELDIEDLPSDSQAFYQVLIDGLHDIGIDCQGWDIL